MPDAARKILMDPSAEIYYSFANVWEVAIKHRKSPDKICYSSEVFESLCHQSGFIPLKTTNKHARMTETLEYDSSSAPEEHNDPFDRLLIAQAKTEGMILISHDHLLPYYHEACVLTV